MRRQAVRRARSNSVAVPDASQPLALKRASVCVEFDSVSVLQSISPGAFILGPGRIAQSDSVSAFKSMRPLASVYPPALRLYA